MENLLWWLLIAVVMIVYPIWLVRSALRGKQWAVDTLDAMRYVGGDLMTTSAWLSLPPLPRPEQPRPDAESAPDHLLA
jgi:hypothetical protein